MRERIDSSSRARTHRLEGAADNLAGASGTTEDHQSWSFRKVSLAGIEPVGFRVKSDLPNHQAIIQPRFYDSLMVRQITFRL